MTWGVNLPGWSSKLKLTALREGCSDTPSNCAPQVTNLAIKEGVSRVYVSMPYEAGTAVSWAAQYSALSLAYPKIVEVGLDDFVNDTMGLEINGQVSDPGTFLTSVINAIKSKNPNLKFGVTVYQDTLKLPAITSSTWSYKGITYKSIPASVLDRIDNVHLFVHYREDVSGYTAAVATAKKIFPHARIFAGAYPYDRIDYLPCAQGGTAHCTLAQEESLYQQLLEIQCQLAKSGTVSGLELFFGYFGDPQDWEGWGTGGRVCSSSRLSACYANTSTLQNISLNVMTESLSSTSGTPVISTLSSLSMGSETVGKTEGPKYVQVKNTGSAAAAISSIVVAGTNGADFPMTENCPTSLAAGAYCWLSVYFRPKATGTRTGDILIYDNASGGHQTIALSGTGTASSGTPVVKLSNTSLSLGTVSVGTWSTPGHVLLTNSGTGPLAISSIGTNGVEFALTENCPTSLGAGLSCWLTIYFKPAGTGTRTETAVIRDNAGTGTQTIALTGVGK